MLAAASAPRPHEQTAGRGASTAGGNDRLHVQSTSAEVVVRSLQERGTVQ